MMALDLETKRQIDEQTLLLSEHQRRLFELQRKAARFGIETPPQVLTEIADIEQIVKAIDATITKLYIGAAREAERHLMGKQLFDNGDGTDTEKRLSALGHYIAQVEDAMRREIAGIYRVFDTWQSSDSVERIKRQKKLDYFLYIIVVLLILLIAISLFR